MNDWLDYKGSGSARAYAGDGLMSGQVMAHALRIDKSSPYEGGKEANRTLKEIQSTVNKIKTLDDRFKEVDGTKTHVGNSMGNKAAQIESKNKAIDSELTKIQIEYMGLLKSLRSSIAKYEGLSKYFGFTAPYVDLNEAKSILNRGVPTSVFGMNVRAKRR